jgi:hypothetical protein
MFNALAGKQERLTERRKKEGDDLISGSDNVMSLIS